MGMTVKTIAGGNEIRELTGFAREKSVFQIWKQMISLYPGLLYITNQKQADLTADVGMVVVMMMAIKILISCTHAQ